MHLRFEKEQREREVIGLVITPVLKVLYNVFNFEDFYLILIGWFIMLSVQTFQPHIVIYRKGNFVYHHQFIGNCLIPLNPCVYLSLYFLPILLTLLHMFVFMSVIIHLIRPRHSLSCNLTFQNLTFLTTILYVL